MEEILGLIKQTFNRPEYIQSSSAEKYEQGCSNILNLCREKDLKIIRCTLYCSPLVVFPSMSRFAIALGIFHTNLYLETDSPQHPGFFLTRGKYRHIMLFEENDPRKIEMGTSYEVGFDPTVFIKKHGCYSFPIDSYDVNVNSQDFCEYMEWERGKKYTFLSNNCTHLPANFLLQFALPQARFNNHAEFVHTYGRALYQRLEKAECENTEQNTMDSGPLEIEPRNWFATAGAFNLFQHFNQFDPRTFFDSYNNSLIFRRISHQTFMFRTLNQS